MVLGAKARLQDAEAGQFGLKQKENLAETTSGHKPEQAAGT